MAKKSSSRTATRRRYSVKLIGKHWNWLIFIGPTKAAAMKYAREEPPAFVTDTMAKIGSEQVWRVDESGIVCVRRRTA